MFLHENDQKMTMFKYFGPRILFVRLERTVGNNGQSYTSKFSNWRRFLWDTRYNNNRYAQNFIHTELFFLKKSSV